MSDHRYNLAERLIDFAVMILDLSEKMPATAGSVALTRQIVRSGTAPALNYGEALSAESPKDFLHKLRICLKELRETQITLQIIRRKMYVTGFDIGILLDECNQLVAIFVTSVETKKRNMGMKV